MDREEGTVKDYLLGEHMGLRACGAEAEGGEEEDRGFPRSEKEGLSFQPGSYLLQQDAIRGKSLSWSLRNKKGPEVIPALECQHVPDGLRLWKTRSLGRGRGNMCLYLLEPVLVVQATEKRQVPTGGWQCCGWVLRERGHLVLGFFSGLQLFSEKYPEAPATRAAHNFTHPYPQPIHGPLGVKRRHFTGWKNQG